MATREAACHCGQLRLEVDGDPFAVSICHCLACQRRTGSAFGMQAGFKAEQVQVAGRFSDFARISDEEDRKEHVFHFCPDCGSQVFYTEPSAEGSIAFTEFPARRGGREVRGVRLRFSEGRIVDASADSEEDFLHTTLDTDEGARRIGELGIGCNPGINRYMRNIYFDEKMNGTIHLALGLGFDYIGGTNQSAIHWDIVKDLRSGGRLELDGKVVQENGVWVS